LGKAGEQAFGKSLAKETFWQKVSSKFVIEAFEKSFTKKLVAPAKGSKEADFAHKTFFSKENTPKQPFKGFNFL